MTSPPEMRGADPFDVDCSKLRVAMLVSYIPPHQSECYRAFARKMGTLSLLLSTPMEQHRSWTHDWTGLDVTVQRTWSIRRRWKHRIGFSDPTTMHLPFDTGSHLKRLRPDVVVSGELGFRTLASVRYKRQNPNTPLIVWACLSEHTEQGRGLVRRYLRRWILKYADAVIVNGASGRRYIRSMDFPNEQISEIPYSIPASQPSIPPDVSVDRPRLFDRVLLSVGQLSERKGTLLFFHQLAAWCQLHTNKRVQLVLVGDGPHANEIAHFHRPENFDLVIAGQLEHADITRHYHSADVLVFPTLADEWGLVVNEAMMHGLPVMGSRYSAAVEELCRHGQNGWIFDPRDSVNVASTLDSVVQTSDAELESMSHACLGTVADITPAACADRFANVLIETIRRCKQGVQHA